MAAEVGGLQGRGREVCRRLWGGRARCSLEHMTQDFPARMNRDFSGGGGGRVAAGPEGSAAPIRPLIGALSTLNSVNLGPAGPASAQAAGQLARPLQGCTPAQPLPATRSGRKRKAAAAGACQARAPAGGEHRSHASCSLTWRRTAAPSGLRGAGTTNRGAAGGRGRPVRQRAPAGGAAAWRGLKKAASCLPSYSPPYLPNSPCSHILGSRAVLRVNEHQWVGQSSLFNGHAARERCRYLCVPRIWRKVGRAHRSPCSTACGLEQTF